MGRATIPGPRSGTPLCTLLPPDMSSTPVVTRGSLRPCSLGQHQPHLADICCPHLFPRDPRTTDNAGGTVSLEAEAGALVGGDPEAAALLVQVGLPRSCPSAGP